MLNRARGVPPHSSPPAAVAMSLVFGAVLALTLAPLEYAHYRKLLDLPDATVRATVGLIIVGKTLGLMLPGLLAGLLVHRLGWRRAGLALPVLWSLGVVAWLWLDLLVHEVTGNHLAFYLGFLGEPIPGDLTPGERKTFVGWFEDFVSRAER